MTPKRKKWWDSLSATQKYLRREISSLKYKRSEEMRVERGALRLEK